MSGLIDYQDQVTLVLTEPGDEYGTRAVAATHVAQAVVVFGSVGTRHNSNQDNTSADVTVFIEPSDSWVQDEHYRLEELLIAIELFGTPQEDAWYEVTDVAIHRDHLLGNQIDNVQLSLKKTASIGYVS
jgi:hypothetical protein